MLILGAHELEASSGPHQNEQHIHHAQLEPHQNEHHRPAVLYQDNHHPHLVPNHRNHHQSMVHHQENARRQLVPHQKDHHQSEVLHQSDPPQLAPHQQNQLQPVVAVSNQDGHQLVVHHTDDQQEQLVHHQTGAGHLTAVNPSLSVDHLHVSADGHILQVGVEPWASSLSGDPPAHQLSSPHDHPSAQQPGSSSGHPSVNLQREAGVQISEQEVQTATTSQPQDSERSPLPGNWQS